MSNLLHGEDEVRYSFSALQNYATCPARAYFSKLARAGLLEEGISLPALFGSAAHKGIEERLKHGTDPHEAAALYVQENLFDKYPGSILDPLGPQIADRRALVSRCLDTFEREFYPSLAEKVAPGNVEVRVEIPYRKGKLTGVVDLIYENDGKNFQVDWKTGLKVPSYGMLQASPQGGFYYLLAKESNGLIPVPDQFVYVYLTGKNQARTPTKTGAKKGTPRTDTRNPQYQYSFPVDWNDKKLDKLKQNYLEPLAAAYEAGLVWKNVSEFNCNGCQFRDICPDFDLPQIIT